MPPNLLITLFNDFFQLHHWDLGIVMGSNSTPPVTTGYGGPSSNGTNMVPYLRLRGITTVPNFVFPDLAILPMPTEWGTKIALEIRASNLTHYTFSAGASGNQSQMEDIGSAPGSGLTWGFTGMLSFIIGFGSRR